MTVLPPEKRPARAWAMPWLALAGVAAVGCARVEANTPSDTIMVGDQLFWREESGSLHVTNSAGSSAHTIANPPGAGECVGDLHVNSTDIFWNDCNQQLWRAKLEGDEPTATNISVGFDFAVDDDNVYFSGWGDALVKQPLAGTARTPLISGMQFVSTVSYEGNLYYANNTGVDVDLNQSQEGIYRVPVSGGDSVLPQGSIGHPTTVRRERRSTAAR
jgi:hypothetical protein